MTTRLLRSGPLLGLFVVLGVFVLLLAAQGQLGAFLSLANLQVLLHESSIPIVAALGALLVIITGGVDLSVGSVVALVTVVAMQVFRFTLTATASPALASLAGVAAGLGTGAVAGLINGLTITGLRLTPFVATLGMLSVARGLAVWLAGRTRLDLGASLAWVDALQRTRSEWLVFDPGVWSALGLALVIAFVLRRTVFGRYCYAIGSNEAAARLSGIRVGRTKVGVYALAGLLAGWAGILSFAQTRSGDHDAGRGLELDVIAGVVIGGASLSGGQGTVLGTVLGVLTLRILENGVSTFGVPIEVKLILIGVIIVANTALTQWQRRAV